MNSDLKTMFRLLLILSLSGMLAACTMSGRKTLDEPSFANDKSDAALIFQSDENFAVFLSASDKLKVKQAEAETLNFGQPSKAISWAGTDGVSGTIVAFQLFRVGTEQCRKFRHKIRNGDKSTTSEATACLGSSGKWQLVR